MTCSTMRSLPRNKTVVSTVRRFSNWTFQRQSVSSHGTAFESKTATGKVVRERLNFGFTDLSSLFPYRPPTASK